MGRTLTVPDVEDDLMDKLTRRAERHGRSVEDEVLGILADSVASQPAEDFWTRAARLRAERERLCAELAALPGVVVFASRANFLLARVSDSGRLHRQLKEAGILVKDVGTMHPVLVNCLRLTVGTPEENRALVQALRSLL